MKVLRDYQEYGVAEFFRYFENGGTGNPLLAYPTGTGKALVIAGIIHAIFARFAGRRIICATHVKELIRQNYDELKEFWPTAPAGVYSSGLGLKQVHFPITFAGIGTLVGNEWRFGFIDIFLIDEAHLLSPKDLTMYMLVIAALRKVNPKMKVVGLTATKWRSGQGLLTEGDNAMFTDIIVDCTTREAFNWFIDQGYLCTLVPRPMETHFDTAKLKLIGGEFDQKQAQALFDQQDKTYAALVETLEYAKDRHHGMIFASGVEHTVHVANMLEQVFGESVTYVHSNSKEYPMSDAERDRRIADYKAGKYKWMVNNGILTTGFNFPALDIIVMLRATTSSNLWVQMLGRGTRPFYMFGFDLSTQEGRLDAIAASQKQNCMVLDFARNTLRLGPVNDPVIPKPKGKGPPGVAPIRECDACGCYNHASATECFFCGNPFARNLKIVGGASDETLVSKKEKAEPIVETFKIDHVNYHARTYVGRPSCIEMNYYSGVRRFKAWLNIEASSGRRMTETWWRDNCGQPLPLTTSEALRDVENLRVPVKLDVWTNVKPPKILKYYYADSVSSNETEQSQTAKDSEMAG